MAKIVLKSISQGSATATLTYKGATVYQGSVSSSGTTVDFPGAISNDTFTAALSIISGNFQQWGTEGYLGVDSSSSTTTTVRFLEAEPSNNNVVGNLLVVFR